LVLNMGTIMPELGIRAKDELWLTVLWGRYDATNPMLKWDTAWRALRDAAGLPGLRFHDLRHTVITELAEMGVADHVLDSISGHQAMRTTRQNARTAISAMNVTGVQVAPEPSLITRARDRTALGSRREPAVRTRPHPAAGIEPPGPFS
jgi:hypothetical protein